MDPYPQSQALRRVKFLARFVVLWAGVLVLRLFYLQVVIHDRIETIVTQQYLAKLDIEAPRGRVVDRNGQTLAISAQVDSVAINPRQTPDLDIAREIFAAILDLDSNVLRKRMDNAVENDLGFMWIKRKITPEQSARLRSLKLPWIQFVPEADRDYPNGSLAAHVIGTVDHKGVGNSGLELSLDEELRGVAGSMTRLRDARRRGIESHVTAEAHPGVNVGLSIDERIQYVADRALARAAIEYGAKTGSAIVLDPYTGEILAMSNYPTFDPNAERVSAADVEARTNNAISVPFEPGSVFKTVTISAALENTDLTPDSLIDCGPGYMTLLGRRIHDTSPHGIMPLRMVLAKSSNVGAIQAALKTGDRTLLEYTRKFGFGRRTNIPLPWESPGLVRDLKDWGRTSIGSIAMGHEMLATTLQLALATAVIANGGTLPEPHLILWRQRPGEPRVTEPVAHRQPVLKPATAITMRRMMEGVVLEGTGQNARLHGYSTGGKTGSAQIYDPELGYYTHAYNSSFVGFAPVQDPKIVIAVALNGVHKYGAVVSAPVYQEVATEALRILGVPPDVPNPEDLEPPDPSLLADLSDASFGEDEPAETTQVRAASPTGNLKPKPEEEQLTAYVYGPEVPDLRGLSLRDALSRTRPLGLEIEYEGAGLVRLQDPSPGSVLPAGRPVRLTLAR